MFSALLEGDLEPRAVLPMRLNSDALSDLVILRNRRAAPIVSVTAPVMTFTVTKTDDSGPGSLRQAILDANDNPGADMISFNILGDGPYRIAPNSDLPIIRGPITIDGTTQPNFAGKPIIELTGSNAETKEGLFFRFGNSTVRGLVINQFDGNGILLIDAEGGTTIEGCFLGTDATGTLPQGNGGGPAGGSGVTILESSNNQIGGTRPEARNLISANRQGVFVAFSTNDKIEGNYIGTDITGTLPLGNESSGVGVSARKNARVGGTVPGARNIISGNYVGVGAHEGNQVQGNYIGTDVTGTRSLENQYGVSCGGATIGGTTIAARNIISGNFFQGVEAGGGCLLQGNFIGTDTTGTFALPNRSEGIFIFALPGNVVIGGTADGAGNLISGNRGSGVEFLFSTGNQVQGNFIGTDATGTKALPNSGHGVFISGAFGNAVGGESPDARNIISGNGLHGVAIGIRKEDVKDIASGGELNRIQGNLIGVDVTGLAALGNKLSGVFVDAESVNNPILSNIIAFNGDSGVRIPNKIKPGVRIQISSNYIFANIGLGIDLGDPGVTFNDDKDGDKGANEQQNFPILVSTSSSLTSSVANSSITPRESTTISGTFNSNPNSTFTIELFLYSGCPNGQAQSITFLPIRLGDRTISTDANGNAAFSFTFDFPSGVRGGWVNATATRSDGNTSEFSQCIMVGSLDPLPTITNVAKNNKQLIVTGANFDRRAKLLINGQVQKTTVESANRLVAKKAGKKVKPEDRLQVRNADGTLSPEFIYRP
jgi:hypothetical protein